MVSRKDESTRASLAGDHSSAANEGQGPGEHMWSVVGLLGLSLLLLIAVSTTMWHVSMSSVPLSKDLLRLKVIKRTWRMRRS
jgi:hypothetical protein